MVDTNLLHEYANELVRICEAAAQEILDVYHHCGDIDVQEKSDTSPVTEADLRANKVIVAALKALTPDLPVLTEETQLAPYEVRRTWERYWIVDPLDGTKEFIRRNDEFTINIALVENNRAVLGVVYIPVGHVAYVGIVGDSAYKIVDEKKHIIKTRSTAEMLKTDDIIEVVASKNHINDATKKFIQLIESQDVKVNRQSKGSSLKFCLLAEGAADVYPRMAPTSEWDTAAAHAVLDAAGGCVVKTDFSPLTYNAKADILNPEFVALADPSYPWQGILRLYNDESA